MSSTDTATPKRSKIEINLRILLLFIAGSVILVAPALSGIVIVASSLAEAISGGLSEEDMEMILLGSVTLVNLVYFLVLNEFGGQIKELMEKIARR